MVYIMFNSSGTSVMSHVVKFCIDISIEGADYDLQYKVNGVLNSWIRWIYEAELILFEFHNNQRLREKSVLEANSKEGN